MLPSSSAALYIVMGGLTHFFYRLDSPSGPEQSHS